MTTQTKVARTKGSLTIKSIEVFADGAIRINTAASKINPKGKFNYKPSQAARLARIAGCPSVFALSVAGVGATLSFEYFLAKKDTAWTDERTGNTGVYTKDHIRIENESIVLNPMMQGQLLNSIVLGGLQIAAMQTAVVPVTDDNAADFGFDDEEEAAVENLDESSEIEEEEEIVFETDAEKAPVVAAKSAKK